MPSKKPKPRKPPEAPWQVILEEIKSQNRAAMEAVEAHHEEMRREVQSFRGEFHSDMSVVRTLLQGYGVDIRDLKTGQARIEAKVDKLSGLEERVGALEGRRTG
jgi:DNA repair ATPase RecN